MTKRFTTDNGSNEDVCLVDNLTKKEYESNFNDIVDLMNKNWEQTQRFEKHNKELMEEIEQLKHRLAISEKAKYVTTLEKENEQLKSDKEHLMGCLIRFFGYDDEDIDYNLNRESNREYGKQYYFMKEETKKELEE